MGFGGIADVGGLSRAYGSERLRAPEGVVVLTAVGFLRVSVLAFGFEGSGA